MTSNKKDSPKLKCDECEKAIVDNYENTPIQPKPMPKPKPKPVPMRDAKGKPTGVFVDAAQELILRAVPGPAPLERDDAFRKAQETLLGLGITATCDMGTSADDWNVLRRAGDAGQLPCLG